MYMRTVHASWQHPAGQQTMLLAHGSDTHLLRYLYRAAICRILLTSIVICRIFQTTGHWSNALLLQGAWASLELLAGRTTAAWASQLQHPQNQLHSANNCQVWDHSKTTFMWQLCSASPVEIISSFCRSNNVRRQQQQQTVFQVVLCCRTLP